MTTLAFMALGAVAQIAVIWLAYVAGHDAGICKD